MREYYKPKFFKTEELVDPDTFAAFGERSLMFLDIRVLKLIDAIRIYFNSPMTINNWHTGGGFKNRGFRNPKSTVGASYSQHRFGRAIDFDVRGKSAEQVRQIILKNQHIYPFTEITRMELGINWVHVDIAMTDQQNIFTFYP